MSQPAAFGKTGRNFHQHETGSCRIHATNFLSALLACYAQHGLCRTCPWHDIGQAYMVPLPGLGCTPQNHSPMEILSQCILKQVASEQKTLFAPRLHTVGSG